MMKQLQSTSMLDGGNAAYLETLYESYLKDPGAVDETWRRYFDTLPKTNGKDVPDIPHSEVRAQFYQLAQRNAHVVPASAATAPGAEHELKQIRVLQIINTYRARGHQHATFNPLGRGELPDIPEIGLHYQGVLSEADMDTVFRTGSWQGPKEAPLRDIIQMCKQVYCGSVGVEYMHITETPEKRWIQKRMEPVLGEPRHSIETRKWLLQRMLAAEGLERYLHSKYVGQKRFSLEGGEALIPMLGELINRAGSTGVQEAVIGMAHRGRLNVLVNIIGKQPAELFGEFEGHYREQHASGDVKYHLGYSSDVSTPGGNVHLTLAFNPSHLEIVSPVVQGSVRSRQARHQDKTGQRVLPIVIHGDAAFAGQGVVMETFNMCQTRGFSTKGTVHIVINNQIGFTTSNQQDARSTLYCTDVAKLVNAPIFHVNGDDADAIHFATQVALDYRMEYGKDVVLDIVCYRRHGHNEADEPAATQPMMYQKIKAMKTSPSVYGARLVDEGVLEPSGIQQMSEEFRAALDAGDAVAPNLITDENHKNVFTVDWSPYFGHKWDDHYDTHLAQDRLKVLAEKLLTFPEHLQLNKRVEKIMADRRKMMAGALPLDWGYAETLAYASLVTEGYAVRLSGQDSGRGTFFHRHAALHNQHDGSTYIPLRNLAENQAEFLVIDSLLSEEAVLAFEYGYATAEPKTLVIWEAQFGDFVNGAQVVIDQFITSGETKWGRLCGLTMFLPHGYEGQGPEHSSARLERFLQLCAEHNVQVCVPTTPAQTYHMLRRQMLRPYRKPLIVMTPKSLLRHKLATSSLEELASGRFLPVIGEIDELDPTQVTRVVMCAGKVYYDLLEKRRAENVQNVAIVRIEQLYPFPHELLTAELSRYPQLQQYVWCQEEPLNQGCWYSSKHHLQTCIGDTKQLIYAGRPLSASPAVGYSALHVRQQHELVAAALGFEN